MHNNIISIRAVIFGKVQAVRFRQTTVEKAHELKLKGWVKNNKDGSVELIASGLPEAVMTLVDWLWQGPPAAEVSHVQWQEVALEKFETFRIL